jgi:general transcription factor 3C polypeptide 1
MAIPCRDHENIVELNKADITKRGVCKFLAVANALELLKVFFLSSSLGSEAQAALIVTFQLYSESEIFTALSFLREKNFMVSMCILSISFSNLFYLFLHYALDVLMCSSSPCWDMHLKIKCINIMLNLTSCMQG